MKFLALILNLPWTLIGLIGAVLSMPTGVKISMKPFALIFRVKSFWWLDWIPAYRGARALANGNVVQLGPLADEKDLVHELIHVQQYEREPFVHFFLYSLESARHGYRNNKYEQEAYSKAGNRYVAK